MACSPAAETRASVFPDRRAASSASPGTCGSKRRPAIVTLLSVTFERERHRFCDLIEGVVRQSVS
jgi:hypothetical protein